MPPHPMRPDLWAQAKPTIDAIRVAGHAWLAANDNPPRAQPTPFSTNQAGWPDVIESSSYSNASGHGPVDWTHLVGLTRSQFTQVGREDVPEIGAFIDFVRREPELATRMSGFRRNPTPQDFENTFFDIEVCSFLTQIVNRAEALGTTDYGSIRSIYCEIERAKFADQLGTQLLVPLALTRLDLEGTLEIAPGVRIETMDDDTQRARAVSTVYLQRVPVHLIAAATHAIVVDDVVIDNAHPDVRGWGMEATDEGLDLSTVDQVVEAVHIATNMATGYAQVCVRPSNWADRWKADLPNITSIRTPRRFPPRFADGGWNATGTHVKADSVALIPGVYEALAAGTPRVRLAARRSVGASMRSAGDDVVIDACIGIEALVGNETDEITHRMAQRAAVALSKGRSPYNPEIVYGLIKTVYAARSAIVHGAAERKRKPVTLGDAKYEPSEVAPILLRALLLSWAEFKWTPESLDKELLRSIPLQRRID